MTSSPPPLRPPWTSTWSVSNDTWLFINDATGERTYEYNYEMMNRGGAQGPGNEDNSHVVDEGPRSLLNVPEGVAYGAGEAVETAEEYKNDAEGAMVGVDDEVAGWFEGAAEAVGEKIGQSVGYVVEAPEKMAEGVGEGVADVQQFGEDVGDAVAQVPEEAMRKVEEGVGEAQETGENVQQYGESLGQAYDQGRREERYD